MANQLFDWTKLNGDCATFVAGMFAEFHNTQNRGNDFTWKKFPEIITSLVKAQIFIIFERRPRNMSEVEEYAYKTAKDLAEALVVRAGYANYSHLTTIEISD